MHRFLAEGWHLRADGSKHETSVRPGASNPMEIQDPLQDRAARMTAASFVRGELSA